MSPRAARASLVLVALAAAASARAMSLTNRFTPMALSADGGSVLVRAEVSGPEGGGALAFEVWSASAPHRDRFEVSSDLSPGNGSRPQKVSGAACAQVLKRLDESLKKRGFRGVAIHAERCGKGRSELVTADARQAAALDAARFRASGNKLKHGPLEVRFQGTEIAFVRDEAKVCTLSQQKREAPAELAVWGGARLIYVIETTSQGDQGLVGLCGGGADGALAPLPMTLPK